ncbi:Tex family protein [Compostibacter hankyongensis]|uniref:Tex family protein n=1 Tax=Compostibacter hankyongensis TaxID=1007089 RepID=A0ABP8G6G1_9BACT
MNARHITRIAQELQIRPQQAEQTMQLLSEGSSVPFISRYRKEATGNLDEVQIGRIEDLKHKYEETDQRREFIIKTISEQGKMTEALQEKLNSTWSLTELEDLYLPYKPKRKTRAAAAIEKGLAPLAEQLWEQGPGDPQEMAAAFLNEQVPAAEDALKGARDILAEKINEDAAIREQLRKIFRETAKLSSSVVEGKEEAGIKYKDYFQFSEALSDLPSHRILAIFRAEKEGILYATLAPAEEDALALLNKAVCTSGNPCSQQVGKAAQDAYKRLLRPSLENEFRSQLKENADEEAITVFAANLRQLLLAAPLGPKPVIAIDPGYRTGCKVVALDQQGSLLDHTVIFPLEKNHKRDEAIALLLHWATQYQTAAIAIGNGTAGRETEAVVKQISFPHKVLVFMVNESGASVYSASEAAREEFPDQDVTVRGAVSIGRRLTDPLAELVKIDPKSIGVGQYQHDVNQSQLKQSLDRVVVSCVNNVGVNLNTASRHLLGYVSGLGTLLADNIIRYRRENGPFRSRRELMQVPRLGEKAFEQCAGFLRIPDGQHPLDNSAVHPERYALVEKIAAERQCSVEDLIRDEQLRKNIPIKDYVTPEVGLPTLQDILSELSKPGRDPRGEVAIFEYAEGIHTMEDLKPGMELPGVVTNITNFGAFVDIGVKQDGLVHISQLAGKFVSDPNEVVKLNQRVTVKVLEVDAARKRISLSMKETEKAAAAARPPRHKDKPRPAKAGGGTNDFQSSLSALKKKFGS